MTGRARLLRPLLLGHTVLSGVVDATSFIALGQVFVANMTGNVVFLGMAATGVTDVSLTRSFLAVGAFLAGALAGGALVWHSGEHRGRLLLRSTLIRTCVVSTATVVAVATSSGGTTPDPLTAHVLIALLATGMGLQTAVARHLAVPDASTTVVNSTLTGLLADSTLTGGPGSHTVRRGAAIVALAVGAGVGAVVVVRLGLVAALLTALALLAMISVAALLAVRGSAAADWADPSPGP